jgi:hypothetical protein
LVWPQFLYVLLAFGLIVYGRFWLTNVSEPTLWANISILLFFIYMVSRICRSAFYGISLSLPWNLETRGGALLRQVRPLWHAWQLVIDPIRLGIESTQFLARQTSQLRRLVIPSITVSTLLSAGFIGGGGFVWQNTPGNIVVVAGASGNRVYSTTEVLAQPTQEILDSFGSESQAVLSLSTPTVPPTATPASRSATNIPLPILTATHTNMLMSIAAAVPTFTLTPLPSVSASLATPVVTMISANSPAPTIMKYAAPVLVISPDQVAYFKGNQPVLRWASVGNLAPNEQYAVRIVYRFQNEVIYSGDQVKELEWTMPLFLFGQVDGPEFVYEWFVFVERLNDDGSTTALSPESRRSSFTWNWR